MLTESQRALIKATVPVLESQGETQTDVADEVKDEFFGPAEALH